MSSCAIARDCDPRMHADHCACAVVRAVSRAQRMERQRAEQERKRQAEAERQRKMREAYNHAQTFHRDDHYQVWYNGAQMTSTRALTYNEPTAFNLREKFWGFGDATIKGTLTWREGARSLREVERTHVLR